MLVLVNYHDQNKHHYDNLSSVETFYKAYKLFATYHQMDIF